MISFAFTVSRRSNYCPTLILVVLLQLLVASPLLVPTTNAYDNGLGLTPPMGWNTWNKYHCDINEDLIKATAKSLVDLGLHDVGYQYINLDDCWQERRNRTGYIVEAKDRFPSGIKSLAAYVHSLGLKFGLYSDSGLLTCQRKPGGLGFESYDAAVYAEWKIDYLKYDNCYGTGILKERYHRMHRALNESGHPIFFSLCEWGVEDPATWAGPVGNSWRTTDDISPTWDAVMRLIHLNDKWHSYAGQGGWNDPDILEVGNGDLTLGENRAHFTLWCLAKAPLLLGNDLTNIPPEIFDIITNKEVIAWNQDPLGVQGYMRWTSAAAVAAVAASNTMNDDPLMSTLLDGDAANATEIWAGDLAGGDVALVLLNRSPETKSIYCYFQDIGITGAVPVRVRDVWKHEDWKDVQRQSLTATVPSHDVVALRLTPVGENVAGIRGATEALLTSGQEK